MEDSNEKKTQIQRVDNEEPIILELDDRLEFGAFIVDTGSEGALDLDNTQCKCKNIIAC